MVILLLRAHCISNKKLVGDTAALQIQQMIASTQLQNNTVTGAIIGIITLILGATGVFTEIQSSINSIWSVKAKPQKGWLKYIINRLISFSLIIGIGFIMVVSLVVNALLDLLSSRISNQYSTVTFYVMYSVNIVFIFLVIAVFFLIVFKVLPDGKIFWKDAFKGAMFTSLLF